MTGWALAVMVALSPIAVPDPEPSYGWVCDYLDSAPTFFGVLGLRTELENRGLDPDKAGNDIITVVRNDCPQHAPLLSGLPLAIGG